MTKRKPTTQQVVINLCFGGFGLSHEAIMRYAELRGFKLYPFTEARDKDGHWDLHKFVAWDGKGEQPFLIHYSKKPLRNGKYANDSYFSPREIERTDLNLVRVVQEMKARANGPHAELSIVEIPAGIGWEIDEYDGIEHIAEKHRTWR